MSFASVLASTFGKRPVWLYEFRRGDLVRFYTRGGSNFQASLLTDIFDQDDIFASEDLFSRQFVSEAIAHSRFSRTGAVQRAKTDILLPTSNAVAQAFLGDGGVIANTVKIYQLFSNDGALEIRTKFAGRVINAKPGLTRTTLECEDRMTELRRKARPAVIQPSCRHPLYSQGTTKNPRCQVSEAAFTVSATATAISGLVVTVADAALQADGYYSAGILTYNGRRQLIRRHSGSSLTLLGPVPGLEAALGLGSVTVSIAPGCDQTRATCKARFNNLANFGGFPWQGESPFGGKILY